MRKNDIIFILKHLGTMLRSGISLGNALATLEEQAEDENLKRVISTIHRDIEAGAVFSEAISRHKNIFTELEVSMIKMGETTGMLDDVIDRIVRLGIQEIEVRARIKTAAIYPLILLTVAIIVIIVLVVIVLPKITAVFAANNAVLPAPTRILLGISYFISHYWYWLLIFIAVGGSQFMLYKNTARGRYNIDNNLPKIPIIGKLYTKVIAARFARNFSVLIKSGVPVLEALNVVRTTIPNVVVAGEIKKIRDAIAAGANITEPFKASGIFPPMVIRMISTGEKTGKLDDMLNDIAHFYETEVDQTINKLSILIEPVFLLIMGVIVGFIAFSVLLPIFNLTRVF
ncbi:MAG: type II secretion system F family protein [Candidatus Omnitrophota bacterium]